jgi:putative NIF3 family GTP cyclohydrolase 1 type 2
MEGSHPFIGQSGGLRENVSEIKIEVIFPLWLKNKIIQALKDNHPYEEVAYEVITTENEHQEIGSGMVGELPEPMEEQQFLSFIRQKFGLAVIRHSPLTGKTIKKVAICGGAGSFLLKRAMASKADAFLTADLKYHDFFEPDGKLIMMDIGHYESEIAAIRQLSNYLKEKFPTFAVLQTKVDTNPVNYFAG